MTQEAGKERGKTNEIQPVFSYQLIHLPISLHNLLKKKNKQNKTTKIYSMIISSYFSVSLSVGESLGDTGDFMLVLFTVTFCMRPGLVCMR